MKQTTTDRAFFHQHVLAKAGLCPLWRTRKKQFHDIYYLCKMKQSHWLLCVAKNYNWSRKIKPLSNLTQASLQILKKMLVKSSQFLSSEQPSELKSLDVALNIAGVEKIRSENLRLRSTWRPFDSSFERKGALVTVKICVLCGR